jgi:hypothetical protein
MLRRAALHESPPALRVQSPRIGLSDQPVEFAFFALPET